MYKCPTCKKRFALKRIGKELASSERISILQEVKKPEIVMEMLLERRSNIFREQEEHTKFIMSVKIVAKIVIDNMKKETPNI